MGRFVRGILAWERRPARVLSRQRGRQGCRRSQV